MENDFKLNFGSLSLGSHDFQYTLTKEFFQGRRDGLVSNGLVEVLLHVEKAERQLSLGYVMNGSIDRDCDICLSNLDYPIHFEGILMIKVTEENLEDQVDLMHVSPNVTELDLADYFYDSVVLSLPMKIKCSDSLNREECDESILNRMNIQEEADPNPEWDKLKDLFNKN